MIFKTESGFVISSQEVWMPGIYDTKETAQFAFNFPDEVLKALMDKANAQSRVITMADLQSVNGK